MKQVCVGLIPIMLFLGLSGSVSWGENSCVECHKKPETIRDLPAWYQDLFVHCLWFGSWEKRNYL